MQAGSQGPDGFKILEKLYGVWGTGCEEVVQEVQKKVNTMVVLEDPMSSLREPIRDAWS